LLALLAPAVLLSACTKEFYLEYWLDPLRGDVVYERPGRDGEAVEVAGPRGEPVETYTADHEAVAAAPQPYDPHELLQTYSWPTSGTVVGYYPWGGYGRGGYGSRYGHGGGYHYGTYGSGDLYGSPWIGRRVGPYFHAYSGSMGFVIGGYGSTCGPRTRSHGNRRR